MIGPVFTRHQAARNQAEYHSKRHPMVPYYPMIGYKSILAIERAFDSEGKPFKIYDDDLEDILAKSDFARRRGRGHD